MNNNDNQEKEDYKENPEDLDLEEDLKDNRNIPTKIRKIFALILALALFLYYLIYLI